MDDYIVRIKRREQTTQEPVGLVEIVASQTRHHFHNFEELRNILADCPSPSPRATGKNKNIKQEQRS